MCLQQQLKICSKISINYNEFDIAVTSCIWKTIFHKTQSIYSTAMIKNIKYTEKVSKKNYSNLLVLLFYCSDIHFFVIENCCHYRQQ